VEFEAFSIPVYQNHLNFDVRGMRKVLKFILAVDWNLLFVTYCVELDAGVNITTTVEKMITNPITSLFKVNTTDST